ncbi:BrnA antitoxin family protein [Massilia sp. KIM]|uniref:BrnA antitoxin family protein n=1 Tax=Massilia sp. KIM TaxID=1955422 RepID=UPI0035A3C6F4
MLHSVTKTGGNAIFTIHTGTTIYPPHREAYGIQRENRMNKEYEPDWDQPVVRSQEPVVSPKAQTANGVKQIVTIRLDVDMLEWFKAAGPGYQTRINQVLREHMDAQRAAANREE